MLAENQLFHFNDYITAGSGLDISRVPNSIVLGKGLAEKLMADVGDVVQVTTSKGERFHYGWLVIFNRVLQNWIKCRVMHR